MSTRGNIGIVNADGTIRCIYTHWDSYPSNNGKLLLEHYTDPAKINALLDLGDISSLDEEIGEKHDFDKFEGKVVNAYGRDRGKDGIEAHVCANKADFLAWCDNSYAYLFEGGKWFYREDEKPLKKLTLKACKEKA